MVVASYSQQIHSKVLVIFLTSCAFAVVDVAAGLGVASALQPVADAFSSLGLPMPIVKYSALHAPPAHVPAVQCNWEVHV